MNPEQIKRVMELVEHYGAIQRYIEDMDHRCEYDDADELEESASFCLSQIEAALKGESTDG